MSLCDCGNPVRARPKLNSRHFDACDACILLDGNARVEAEIIAALRLEPDLMISEITERIDGGVRQIARAITALLVRGRVRRWRDVDITVPCGRFGPHPVWRYRLTQRISDETVMPARRPVVRAAHARASGT